MAFTSDAARNLIRTDPAAAEDVAQDALLRAWTRAGSYDPAQAAVGTWLHRIAVNAAIDRMRATRHSVAVPDDLHDAAPMADVVIAGQQRSRILAEAIATLPDRQRTALALLLLLLLMLVLLMLLAVQCRCCCCYCCCCCCCCECLCLQRVGCW